jgi:glycosyltransferase involved in cell wall biosynthesis
MTMPLPFVSVIVPTRNRRDLLARLLDSLLAQDWPRDRYEIIVVNNHTPDGTDALVAERAAASPVPIRYFATDFPAPGHSRQFGAERAQGSVLAFIDDDCRATPGWIAAGAAAIASGLALVQGRTCPDPAQPRHLLEKTQLIEGPTAYFETCNIFYDATVFRAVGGFPRAFRDVHGGEDASLGWEVRLAGHPTGFSADALVHHEVFAVSYLTWLREVRVVAQVPALARAYPALRRELYLRYFLARRTAFFDLFALGAMLGLLAHPAALGLCLPYVGLRLSEGGRSGAPHLRVARLLFAMPRAAVMAGVLAWQSLRARSVVL